MADQEARTTRLPFPNSIFDQMPTPSSAVKTAILVVSLLTVSGQLSATEINAGTANLTSIVGGGYRSERQLLTGGECLSGENSTAGGATSSFNLQQSMSSRQASSELGMSVGGRARYGVVEASFSAAFLKSSSSTSYSTSAIWLSYYQLPVERLKNPVLTAIGRSVRDIDERWNQTCGDEYVAEVTRGAKLMFSIRIDFRSAEEKQKFDAKFSVSGPMASTSGTFQQAQAEFSKDTTITISALQFGGDVSKLTKVFSTDGAGQQTYIECSLGKFEACASVLASAIKYASDTTAGFPSQLAPGVKPGPADLSYKTVPYTTAGIYPKNYPFLTQSIDRARSKLSDIFEEQFKLQLLGDQIAKLPLASDKKTALDAARGITDRNIFLILEISKVCYNKPEDCPDKVANIKLAAVDLTAFSLPALPTASYRLLTTFQGILSRQESIDKVLPVLNKNGIYGLKGEFGEVSSVLLLDGVALRQVDLKFETLLIATIALSGPDRIQQSKAGNERELLVLETTRSNPGWLDFDMQAAPLKIAKSGLENADGFFYAVVKDAFGREVRFDLGYAKWKFFHSGSGGCSSLGLAIAGASVGGKYEETWDLNLRANWWDSRNDGLRLADVPPNTWTQVSVTQTSCSLN